jgi:TatD DNase family protein
MRLLDAHCHLHDERYDAFREVMLGRAVVAGVGAMVCCGVEEADWRAVGDLAGLHPEVIPALGVHPWYVGNATAEWEQRLESLLSTSHAAVGEIGLDFAIEAFDQGRQEYFFRRQLALACRFRRPVSIHCRKAWERTLTILGEYILPAGGLIHSYSGSAELVPRVERIGLMISFSGVITRPHNRRGHEALRRVSTERLLIETDSPDLTPLGAAQQLNEPANLPLVARQAALLRGIAEDDLAQCTYDNGMRLFGGCG